MAAEAPATDPAPRAAHAPRLTVVLPTFNERDNIAPVVAKLDAALGGHAWEAIFVDDNSPDGTASEVKRIALTDPRIRCIHRFGRRGLSGACVEGMLSSAAPYVAVMDADLQHDESLLPRMVAVLDAGEADLVVASRFVEGGDVGTGLSATRAWGSGVANALARKLLGVELTDPMSGFFMIRREMVDAVAPKLSAQGFKIMLDIAASAEGSLRIKELPFVFRERLHGESKLDTLVTLEYLGLLVSKLTRDLVSVRFLMFGMVGASGVIVHLASLRAGLITLPFDYAQTLATFVAMTWNFFLNNQLTYRDRRLTGLSAVKGLLSFYVVCSVGVVANVGVASWIYGMDPSWWMAGTAGAAMGAVWNYVASSVLTWRRK
ncbi:glycosyltransferase family 2 protein [Breoghania sp. L-A4]|uniref:glycosyltransferase family 2 protein n=1 Tax=Breoghania sp. L-A4 TaxID=2304600 RepID=UPI000E35F47D|nr:glycosyltransferase family 2 protein [Breoghania sp. L-A4]AXS39419.1 glycosyltransferase family 2 protein [Breoghania sp. L-A4]